jgi:sirohydrochlorin cobaltochelatase
MNTSIQAIILFAHGSRDPLWRKPIEAVGERIRAEQPGLPVRCAYLELCEPSLPDAAQALVHEITNTTNSIAKTLDFVPGSEPKSSKKPLLELSEGLKPRIRIVPMFLGMGKHAREDLPELAAQLRQQHSQVEFEVAPTVGEDTRLTALLAQMAMG